MNIREGNHRTIHLSVADKATDIIAAGRAAQSKFCEIVFAGFSKEEMEKLHTVYRASKQKYQRIYEWLGEVYRGK